MDSGQFRELLEKDCGLDLNHPVVAGVSGGPDSLCMLDLLLQNNLKVIVGHLNHKLRPEADEEAEFVTQFCKSKSIDCVVVEKDVAKIAGETQLSLEEAGRKLRYEFLFDLAERNRTQAVLVAHNADDQVETILMHLLRGSGLAGLKGMEERQDESAWSTSIPLVRPLLRFSRADILEYCRERGLTPVMDKSNDDPLYYRNRIRKELVPFLTTFNPQIKGRLISMADVVQFEDDFLSIEVKRASADAIVEKNDRFFIFSLDATANLHPAILRRLIVSSIHHLNPGIRNISHENISRAASFLRQDSPGDRIDLAGNFELVKYLKKTMILCDCDDRLDDLWPRIQQSIPLQNLGKVGIPLNGKWRLTLSEDNAIDRSDAWRCCLDADQLESLTLDKFKPGEKFIPQGMNGKSQKLGDYWTNEGLPVKARADWPLVRSGEEIAWVPGFRIGDRYKITGNTRRILSLQLKKDS